MARRIRYSELENRTARDRLKPGKKVHWRTLDTHKLALGYRRLRKAVPGEWLRRRYLGTDERGIGHYKQEPIGKADDFADADGVNIFDFSQAQSRARGQEKLAGPLTVRKAVTDYIVFLKAEGRLTNDTERRANAHILPELGDVLVDELTPEQIRKWLADYACKPAWIRTNPSKFRKTKAPPLDDEAVRRRRSSANRVLTILKAALNHAYDEGRVTSNAAWGRRVKPFRAVDVARIRYLTIDEVRRLVNACESDFRLLVRAALETGARYGELTRLRVADFNPDAGTVHVRQSKGGKDRHVVLSEDGASFFHQIAMGRMGDDLLFRSEGRIGRARAQSPDIVDAGEWRASEQGRPMAEAVTRAKIKPAISFHGLRHTWASHAVMNGVPLMVVAKNLGHADTTMVEKHYGHLAPSYITDAIRAGAPRYGLSKKGTNIRPIGGTA